MKPLHLTIDEFGPYTEQQTIDFGALKASGLFLIHGRTGSGKSSIMDAICFALYGETSGDERDGKEMRSHFASDDEPTEVTLTFALGDKTYRITRRPAMEMAKVRGEGTTRRSPEATLWDRTEAAPDEEGTLVANGKRDVGEAIEARVGFTADEFRQVVMLPQGKFRSFLAASSSDREEILKKLFDTSRFEQLQEELKRRARAAKDEAQKVAQQIEAILENRSVESREALEALYAEQKKEQETRAAEATAAKRALTEARKTLEQAQQVEALFAEHEKAESALAEAQAGREAHQQKKAELQAAQRAQRVAPTFERLEEQAAEQAEAAAKREEAQGALQTAAADAKEAQKELTAAEARQAEREALQEEITTLKGLVEKVEQYAAAGEAVAKAKERKAKAEAAKAQERAAVEKLSAKQKELSSTREATKEVAGTLKLRTSELKQAEEALKKSETLAEKRAAATAARNTLKTKTEALTQQEEKVAALQEKADTLLQARLDGQAALLARELTEGDPCPVCGATHHPAPATSEVALPDEAALEQAKAAAQKARAAIPDLRTAADKARTTLATLEAEVAALSSGELFDADTERDTLRSKRDEAQTKRDEAQEAADRLPELDEQLQKTQEALAQKEKALESATAAVQEATGTLERAQERRKTLGADVPAEFKTAAQVTSAREQKERQLQQLKEALKQAQEANQEATTALARATSTRDAAQERLDAAKAKHTKAEAAFTEALQNAGFADPEAFQDAYRSDEAMAALQEAIASYEKTLTEAEGRLKRAEAAVASKERPDVEALASTVEAKAKAHEAAVNARAQANAGVQDLSKDLDTVTSLAQQQREEEQTYQRIGVLAEAAQGKNEKNLSLQRFVLASRLEEVLEMANARFATMSQSRYQLYRATEVSDARRGAGLDLLVDDAYTGERRPVSTLSGGEGFQAALALALGLSDTVQNAQGGRRLETLFIDEGFGSLDAEALDRALETLLDLRTSGRLVGIISHVAELKERIDARVEVQAGMQGSRVQVQAPAGAS
ncbi:MAG: AAA family ATPase [Bacteroidetes bacterium]|jgi:exonuclease SbcC|nr:AAA family ATPase [Bacteroidota bacterium]